MTQQPDLRASAKSGLMWGVGFTLARDVVQFLAMLVLVRLLSPEVYGQQALAQTVIGFIAVASMKALSQYPLASRDPKEFDWDTYFTASALLNLLIFVLALAVGWAFVLIGSNQYATTGFVILALSPVFIVEIAATYRFVWLQAHHRWRRMRLLLLLGTAAGSIASIMLALAGWGVYALAIGPVLFGVPMLVDLLLFTERRPQLKLHQLKQFADGAKFGLNRAISGVALAGSSLAENAAMSGFFGFAALGSFSRAIGLAQITSGRIGPVAVGTLYPILTRAEAQSDRFRRFAALLLQGIAWTSIPAAVFLAVEAPALVELLYGHRWLSVTPLLPLASAIIALRGLFTTLNQIMLANMQVGACLKADLGITAAGLTAILVAIPFGVIPYMTALLLCELLAFIGVVYLATQGGAIALRAILNLMAPCVAATIVAATATILLPPLAGTPRSTLIMLTGLILRAMVFALTYAVLMRVCAPQSVVTMLEALPIPAGARKVINRLLPQAAAGA